jgi:hypothetical protein
MWKMAEVAEERQERRSLAMAISTNDMKSRSKVL